MSGYNLLELAYSDFVIEIISRPKQAHIMNRCTSLKAFFWKEKEPEQNELIHNDPNGHIGFDL